MGVCRLQVGGRRPGVIDEVLLRLGTCIAHCIHINSIGTRTRQSAVMVYNWNYLCVWNRVIGFLLLHQVILVRSHDVFVI